MTRPDGPTFATPQHAAVARGQACGSARYRRSDGESETGPVMKDDQSMKLGAHNVLEGAVGAIEPDVVGDEPCAVIEAPDALAGKS